MEVLELKGYKALRAFNGFHALMLGMKMLPMNVGDTYEVFFKRVEEMSECERERLIRQAVLFVELSKDEVEAIVSFCTDPNGVPYQPANLKHAPPEMIVEMIVAVCLKIADIKVTMVSEGEKKKLANCSVDLRRCFAKNPNVNLSELINLAFYEAVYPCSLRS